MPEITSIDTGFYWVRTRCPACGILEDVPLGLKPVLRRTDAETLLKVDASSKPVTHRCRQLQIGLREVVTLWRAKGGTPGPSQRTRAWARRTFTEPDPPPDLDGCPTCEDVADLVDTGESWPHILHRLNRTHHALEQHLRRHGRPDLIRGTEKKEHTA